jgi:hydroxyethylthiazole kinase-like uncharacterized protein yjeF
VKAFSNYHNSRLAVLNTLSNIVYEQPDSLKPAIDQFKLEIQKSGWVTRQGGDPPLLNNEKFLRSLFSEDVLKNKRNSEAIEIAPNMLIAARILDHEHDAIVVGPGLRPGLATTELVRSLLPITGETDSAPLVLDAEALRSMATMDGWWTGERRPAVLTPHAGEFARLRAGSSDQPVDDGDLEGDDAARLTAALDAAATWGSVVVLKGARTIIAAPDGSAAIAPFENPALATGGTGDVLAGAIGALLAQGLDPFAAARAGVYLHGMAGDTGRDRFGDAGMLASDLPDALALARKRLVAATERRTATKRLGFAARDSGSVPASPVPASSPGIPGDLR